MPAQREPLEQLLPIVKRMIEPMTEAVVVVDRDGLVVALNPSAISLLDLSDERAGLRPLDEYDKLIGSWRIGDELIAPHELRRALTGEEIRRQHATITTAADVQHLIEFSTTPIRDEAGNVDLAMLVAQDITEETREAAYTKAVATAATGLTTELDVRHVLESAIDVIVEALGGQMVLGIWRLDDEEQALRLRIHRGISDETAARLASLPLDCDSFICEAAHSREVLYTEDTRVRPPANDSDRRLVHDEGLISWIASPLLATGQLIGTMGYGLRVPQRVHRQDVDAIDAIAGLFATAMAHAELYEESERRREQLEAERDLRALFMAAVAHEIRQPLTAIRGFGRLLARSQALSARDEEFAEQISEQTLRLERMVDDLSDSSKIAAGHFSLEARPAELVGLVDAAVRAARGRGADVRLHAPDQVRGTWDSDRLRSVMDNLLTNAQKFSPPGAAIRVDVSLQEADVLVEVSDQGAGIEPADLDNVFQPFTRLEAASGVSGTGLGLYIARSIVEGHGGRIWVESAGPGTGSTFSFTLPHRRPE